MQNYASLWKILQNTDLILTPNKRLRTFLLHKYGEQQKLKKESWATPEVFTFVDWIYSLWETQLLQNQAISSVLLTPYEEKMLWQKIIGHSTETLLRSDHVAQEAQQAWQLIQFWQINYRKENFEQSDESCTWKKWAKQFLHYSQQHKVIDYSLAITALISLFSQTKLTIPKRIFVIGFDDLNPLTAKLFDTLQQKGCVIHRCNLRHEEQTSAYRMAFPDRETELQTMARWAHQQWKQGEQEIFCVVPQLLKNRISIIDQFYDVFTSLQSRTLNPWPFNIAGGRNLTDYPLIQTLFNILKLKTQNTLPNISALIRSPFLPYAEEECFARTQLDLHCRRYADENISLKNLIVLSEQHYCLHLTEPLTRLFTFIKNNTPFIKNNTPLTLQLPSHWCHHFTKILQCIWPNYPVIDPELSPLLTRWSEQLHLLSRVDFLLGKISSDMALSYLYQSSSEHIFQPKTPAETPIQVLGLLDTAGLCVKNLWLMRFDEQTWPAPAQPNPFIPIALQRQKQLPHASNEREFYFASQLTQRLLQSASRILVSYSTQTNEQKLRPSRLITHLPEKDFPSLQLTPYQYLSEQIWSQREWEFYTDEYAPKLGEQEVNRGGASLFKKQAACPFQAFAFFRLHAQFYPFPKAGLSPIERGQLLHEVLEILWSRLQNQANLKKMDAKLLDECLESAIETIIKRWQVKKPFTWRKNFTQLEKIRLRQRLEPLMEWEKKRPPFYNVQHEQKRTFQIGPITLELRIDRLDQLADNRLLIIDYKTGTLPSLSAWIETRMDEPQLPLYCLSQPKARGFAVLQLSSHGLDVKGLSEHPTGLFPALCEVKKYSLPNEWESLRMAWQASLEALAKEYQLGWAAVRPKQGPTTCRHCDLQLLCRIHHHEQPEHHDPIS